jgi:hypothetical protein
VEELQLNGEQPWKVHTNLQFTSHGCVMTEVSFGCVQQLVAFMRIYYSTNRDLMQSLITNLQFKPFPAKLLENIFPFKMAIYV